MTQDPDRSHLRGRATAATTPAAPTDRGRWPQLAIVEIFGPTVQGEGALIGVPTVFVRTGGCEYRCSWCDSLHAVLPEYRPQWRPMGPGRVVEEVLSRTAGRPVLVTLSGGNPALQPMEQLLIEGAAAGLTFALETQGSTSRGWMSRLDHLVLSPKPPSSGMKYDGMALGRCLAAGAASTSLKVVVMDQVDLEWALQLHRVFPAVPFYLQVGNPEVAPPSPATDPARFRQAHRAVLLERLEWLTEQVLAAGAFDVRVLPQLHTLLWGNDRGR